MGLIGSKVGKQLFNVKDELKSNTSEAYPMRQLPMEPTTTKLLWLLDLSSANVPVYEELSVERKAMNKTLPPA